MTNTSTPDSIRFDGPSTEPKPKVTRQKIELPKNLKVAATSEKIPEAARGRVKEANPFLTAVADASKDHSKNYRVNNIQNRAQAGKVISLLKSAAYPLKCSIRAIVVDDSVDGKDAFHVTWCCDVLKERAKKVVTPA